MKKRLVTFSTNQFKKSLLGTLSLFLLLSNISNAQTLDLNNLKFGKKKNTEEAPKSERKDKEDVSPVTFELDINKDQIAYLREFAENAKNIYAYEYDKYDGGWILKSTYKPEEFFELDKKMDGQYVSPTAKASVILKYDGKYTFYPNYDKGATAWVKPHVRETIDKEFGEGKKYKEVQAVDYSGVMFFPNMAMYVNYNRYDEGKIYKVSEGNYVYVTNKGVLKGQTPETFAEKIKDYLVRCESDGFIKNSYNTFNAAEKEKTSLEGKKIKAIQLKFTDPGAKFNAHTNYPFDVEVTLEDGKVRSTKDGLIFSNFTFEGSGLSAAEFNSGKLSLDNKTVPAGDKVSFTVKTIYQNDVKTKTYNYTVDYNTDGVDLNYYGTMHGTAADRNGKNIDVEVKQVKHAVTGEDLLEYRVRYANSKTYHQIFRCQPSAKIIAHANGVSWGTSASSNNGPDGGDGGTVRLIVDPNVTVYSFNANTKGGKGAIKSGSAKTRYLDGLNGRDGLFETFKRPVIW